MANTEEGKAFEIFDDSSPKGKQQSDRFLFDYEKHYMQLLSSHREDIDFINQCLRLVREEQRQMSAQLATINQQLDEALVDSDVKNVWLKHMAENMSRSFALSNDLLEHFYIMELDQFKTELKKRLMK